MIEYTVIFKDGNKNNYLEYNLSGLLSSIYSDGYTTNDISEIKSISCGGKK